MPRSGSTLLRLVTLTTAGAVLLSACDVNALPRVGGGQAPSAEPTIAAQTAPLMLQQEGPFLHQVAALTVVADP